MAEDCGKPGARDWAGDWRTLVGLWGLPAAAMLASTLLPPAPRAVVWASMLLGMGVACLVNARRCGRIHCRVTGPFLVLMAAAVVAYAADLLRLGPDGWSILGGVSVVGFAGLWWGSERLWGMFPRRGEGSGTAG